MSQPPPKQTASVPSVMRPGYLRKRPVAEMEGSSTDKVRLRVLDQEGGLREYDVPRNLPIRKFVMRFCQDRNLEYQAMAFIYNGCRLRVRSTPEELHMKDGDQIEAMVQVGGGGGHLTF